MTDELEITTNGALGCIALNRPQAINALSLDMIWGILEALLRWQFDPAIGAVVFSGNGLKGFCSGGDVRAARALVLAGTPDQADIYFATEYRMNALIAAYPKPLVTLGHGITMGGGIGIAGHCAVRVTQPGARFAMPESAIGFFADVGVNAIVAKAPLNRALLFLMTGVSVGPADALALGLADAVVAPERAGPLRVDFVAAAASSNPGAAIGRLLEAESIEPGEVNLCALADLLPDTPPETPSEFVDRVAGVPALAEIAALLKTRSPSAMTATFHAQFEARRLMNVAQTLDMDLRLASLMGRRADFAEGVRAVLVDKDQKPNWSPASFGALDPAPILRAVKGF